MKVPFMFPPRVVDPDQITGSERLSLSQSWPLVAMHLLLLTVPLVGVSTAAIVALAITYAVRVFALTGGYHRYFSHRTFKTSRAFQFILALIGTSAAQLSPLWWAAHHRHHHQHSDDDEDAHSPRRKGLFRAHIGWLMCDRYAVADASRVKDLLRYPELRWLDRLHMVPPLLLAASLYGIGELLRRQAGIATTGWQLVVWGFVVSTLLVYHVTFCINSLTHVFGTRRFETDDDSRNSLLLALLTMGEGWHNNHHRYSACARQGFLPREIDMTYYVLLLLARMGLIWDIRQPPADVIAEAAGTAQC